MDPPEGESPLEGKPASSGSASQDAPSNEQSEPKTSRSLTQAVARNIVVSFR
jgi:hypothetical protein